MTSTTSALLPTSVSLNGQSAIDAILSDIPLFCEGIMAIGVFTFLFITKQVKIPIIFLYGACFLAFAAATLDLGQVLIRRQSTGSTTKISLDSIAGFIYAREVFLSLSIFSLDIFFWFLVAQCPRAECSTRSNELSTRTRTLPSTHSASWNRWGIVGTILKYGSLAALLSVPLLSMLWRLTPAQRTHSSTYVAESIIQATVMAIFLLKIFLNISISPLESWWSACCSYTIPVISLMFGIALGTGNVVLFSFTETPLGRFLHAVQVYLVIVNSLFSAFHDHQQRRDLQTSLPLDTTKPEKTQYIAAELPIAYTANPYHRSPEAPDINRVSNLSWILPPRRITPVMQEDPRSQMNQVDAAPPPEQVAEILLRQQERNSSSIHSTESVTSFRQPLGLDDKVAERASQTYERTLTGVSLSYYAMDSSRVSFNEEIVQPPLPLSSVKKDRGINSIPSLRPSTGATSINSNLASITSIDEILRQQTELDQTIAEFRLVSMSVQPTSDRSKTFNGQSRSNTGNSKTNSMSNRSDFSLSIFPDPPIILTEEVATKYPPAGSTTKRRRQTAISTAESTEKETEPPAEITPAPSLPVQFEAVQVESAVTYDVTSFIGDLSEPSRNPEAAVMPAEDLGSDSEGTPTVLTAQLAPTNGLRPMILSSAALNPTSYDSESSFPPRPYEEQRMRSSSNPEPVLPLRPLLLGKPAAYAPPTRISPTKIPLAQRRKRGGTISSNTRRPVISAPSMSEDRNEGVSGVFERPRPPPLVLR